MSRKEEDEEKEDGKEEEEGSDISGGRERVETAWPLVCKKEDLRAMVRCFVEVCRRRDLKFNVGKGKVMVLGWGEGFPLSHYPLSSFVTPPGRSLFLSSSIPRSIFPVYIYIQFRLLSFQFSSL